MADSNDNRSYGKHLRAPDAQGTTFSTEQVASTSAEQPMPALRLRKVSRVPQDLPGFDDDAASAPTQAASASRQAASASIPSGMPSKKAAKQMTLPKKRGHLVSNLLLVLGISLLIAAGVLWVQAQRRYADIDEMNEKLATYAVIAEDEVEQTVTPPSVDWESLKAINDDVVAWIQIPGTVINYPIYQSDDNDYYLNTDAEGNYGIGGQIFLDYQNSAPGMVDRQTIVYGHHMKNGAMFKQVADMDNQQYFDSINTVWYVTEEQAFEMMPLFVYHTDPNDANVRIFSFDGPDAFHTYLSELMAAKGVALNPDAEAIIAGADRILTLSTCNYIEGSGRTMLVCVEKAEAERVLSPTGP